MATSTRVLTDYAIAITVEYGASDELHGGFRTISKSSFSSFDSDETIEIPDEINSAESPQFCGFDKNVANDIYRNWRGRAATSQPGDLGYGEDLNIDALHYIRAKARENDALDSHHDWDGALRNVGMAAVTRARILSDKFTTLRLTTSASEWALDTVEIAWEFLLALDNKIKKKKLEVDRPGSPDTRTS